MGLITGEFEHPDLPEVKVTVDAKERGSVREPWSILGLSINFADIRTPDELISLGNWCVFIGNRIKQEYNSNGTKKSKQSKLT